MKGSGPATRFERDNFEARKETLNLDGDFKYFVIFIPTWGRLPFKTNIVQMG